MIDTLDAHDLRLLIERVFRPGPDDSGLAIMVDLPDRRLPDNPDWAVRRRLAIQWAALLAQEKEALNLQQVTLAWYGNVGGNNADLPHNCVPSTGNFQPETADELAGRPQLPFTELFAAHSLILAPTELSATAPLKVATRAQPFRAATMPGFLPTMIPALKIDYGEVNRRVDLLKKLLDTADGAEIRLGADGHDHRLWLDLRHREGHASGGQLPDNGAAGNLPSGEAYIVPYEGELPDDQSGSRGTLPVQIEDEVVIYAIEANRAVQVVSDGPASAKEADKLTTEPAYANLAELGLGVLGDFGLRPTGSILLDEKLGLHVAFGRSDHFGGAIGPADFSSPAAVIHLDRVYIPETQPRVTVQTVALEGPDGRRVIMRDGRYVDIF